MHQPVAHMHVPQALCANSCPCIGMPQAKGCFYDTVMHGHLRQGILDLVGNRSLPRKFAEAAKNSDLLRHTGYESWVEQLVEGVPVTAVRMFVCEDRPGRHELKAINIPDRLPELSLAWCNGYLLGTMPLLTEP